MSCEITFSRSGRTWYSNDCKILLGLGKNLNVTYQVCSSIYKWLELIFFGGAILNLQCGYLNIIKFFYFILEISYEFYVGSVNLKGGWLIIFFFEVLYIYCYLVIFIDVLYFVFKYVFNISLRSFDLLYLLIHLW